MRIAGVTPREGPRRRFGASIGSARAPADPVCSVVKYGADTAAALALAYPAREQANCAN
jgi:hypothetical protein